MKEPDPLRKDEKKVTIYFTVTIVLACIAITYLGLDVGINTVANFAQNTELPLATAYGLQLATVLAIATGFVVFFILLHQAMNAIYKQDKVRYAMILHKNLLTLLYPGMYMFIYLLIMQFDTWQ